jgi:hypothetical protein
MNIHTKVPAMTLSFSIFHTYENNKVNENIVYCFICDHLFHDFNIVWLLVFQMLRFYLH